MAAPVKINYKMYQGSTFREIYRWESSTKRYVPITAIQKSAPVVITAPIHQIPVGWRTKITGVNGMKEINTGEEYVTVTAKTQDTITINSINSIAFNAYTTGGVLEYNEPVDLTNYTARMQIRPKLESTEIIAELTTENGLIRIDPVLSTITVEIPAQQTEDFTFTTAVYSLELVKGLEVIPFCNGTITLIKEVTR